MNFKSSIILSLACISIVSCSNGGSSGDTTTPQTPPISKDLSTKTPLTKAQLDQVKSFMAKTSIVPGLDLILVSDQETYENQQERLKKIAELKPDAKAVYTSILANCKIDQPITKTDGELNQVGSSTTVSSQGTISGALPCPVIGQITNTNTTMLAAVAADHQSMDLTIKGHSETHSMVNDPALTTKSDVITEGTSMNTTGGFHLANNSQMTGTMQGFGSTMVTTKSFGQIVGDIKMTADFQTGGTPSSAYAEINLPLPFADMTVQVYNQNNQSRYYINGVQFSEADIKDILGSTLSFNNNNSK